jgi:hypothetical protein
MRNRNLRLHHLMALSQVPRWSIVPTVPRQTVGEHTLNVALMVWWVFTNGGIDDTAPRETSAAVMAALFHDAAECLTGDTPTPAKNLDRTAALQVERKALGELGLDNTVGYDHHPVVVFCDLADALASVRLGFGGLALAVENGLRPRVVEALERAKRYPGVHAGALDEVYAFATGAVPSFDQEG